MQFIVITDSLFVKQFIILYSTCMSKKGNSPQGKGHNPLHSSFILTRNNNSNTNSISSNALKLSHLYTKATSEFDVSQVQDQAHLVAKYESRIKGLESGYERSKEQYQNSLKSMYKQKMILLNIISHNHSLVDQFRNKIRLDGSTFKEVETKYNIIASAIFQNQLCSNCILSITNTELHSKTVEKDKELPRTPDNSKSRNRRLGSAKQYSWMYVPNTDSAVTAKLRAEVLRLRASLEEQQQQKAKRMQEKNKQIQQLKTQLAKPPSPLFSFLPPFTLPKEEKPADICEKPTPKMKEKLKQLENELSLAICSREKCQALLRDSNERMTLMQLEKLNAKYRSKFF